MFPIPYGHIIGRFPNIAPNSRSKVYRRFKAAYEERATTLLNNGCGVEEASVTAFVQILNINVNN